MKINYIARAIWTAEQLADAIIQGEKLGADKRFWAASAGDWLESVVYWHEAGQRERSSR